MKTFKNFVRMLLEKEMFKASKFYLHSQSDSIIYLLKPSVSGDDFWDVVLYDSLRGKASFQKDYPIDTIAWMPMNKEAIPPRVFNKMNQIEKVG